MNNSLCVSNKTHIDLNASIILTEWLYKGSIPLQLSNLNYIIMKIIFNTLPNELKNYFSLHTDYFINGYSSLGVAILKDDNFNDFYFCIDTYKEFINIL